jgi:hypothetical protein
MDRSWLKTRRNRNRTTTTAAAPFVPGFVVTSRPAAPARRRRTPEDRLLADLAASLSDHAVKFEQIKGQKDVSAVEGYVGCAAIVGALIEERWNDEPRAMELAARALVLSRSYLQEFLEASGGAAPLPNGTGKPA